VAQAVGRLTLSFNGSRDLNHSRKSEMGCARRPVGVREPPPPSKLKLPSSSIKMTSQSWAEPAPQRSLHMADQEKVAQQCRRANLREHGPRKEKAPTCLAIGNVVRWWGAACLNFVLWALSKYSRQQEHWSCWMARVGRYCEAIVHAEETGGNNREHF
jgi:hypothetical protein